MKVLVAEDDRISRKILAKVLGQEGYEILEVSDGESAWDVLERENIRLVISDWVMPRLDGVSLCKRIRGVDLERYVYVIMVTAKTEVENLVEGLEAGADDFIFKPINTSELLVKLKVGRRILKLEDELSEKNRELARANELLKKMTLLDPLTGIGNRRFFHQYISKVHANYLRYNTPYCLAMADVDNFKAYNDTYGHREGDKVLKLLAKTIKDFVRKSDEVFRFGGEELVIVFSNQRREGGVAVSERVREVVESLAVPPARNEPFEVVTISIGIGCSEELEGGEVSWESVLKIADTAMYRAKANGKNCVATLQTV